MTSRFYPLLIGLAAPACCLMASGQGCRPAAREQAAAPRSVAGPAAGAAAESARFVETRRLMGVPWSITLYAASPEVAAAAIKDAFAEIARLESILSDYDPSSELSRLSAVAPTAADQPVGPDLWRVLRRAVELRDATAGAFDPTVGPLTTLWRQSRRSGRMPHADKLAAARSAVGPDTLVLVPERRAVSLKRPGMRLDLGGIGMGYAIDRAMEVLARHGIASAMIDASGDIAVSAAPPGTSGWTIAVGPPANAPSARLLLTDAAVTTSGDAFQAVEIDGVRYSHVVDPSTGLGVVGPAAVTVVAPDCTTADALATAASVLGPQRGLEAVAGMPGCAARFVWQLDGKAMEACSPAWPGN